MKNSSASKIKSKIFIPDLKHTALLVEMGRLAGQLAVKENRDLCLPVTYLENDKIIREHSDGKKETIGTI